MKNEVTEYQRNYVKPPWQPTEQEQQTEKKIVVDNPPHEPQKSEQSKDNDKKK